MPATYSVLAFAALAATVSAHMEMIYPAPWNSKHNPNTPAANIDYSYTSPLDASGSNYPCKGYNSVLGTDAGKSVASWAPGSSQSLQLAGTAVHGGGSCQAMLSYDGGHSFKVIKSYEGNCPLQDNWQFTIPGDAPPGEAVFAWSWFNNLGNREMYHNCATVTIGGNPTGRRKRGPSFDSLPANFVANVGNGCSTTEGGDVQFPDPGPDVERNSNKLLPPVGSCGSGSGSGGKPQPPAPSPSAPATEEPSNNSTASGGEWTPESNSTSESNSAEASPSPSHDAEEEGEWSATTTTAHGKPSVSMPVTGQWHNAENNTSSEGSSKPHGSKCNRRVRRHKKRVAHGSSF